MVQTAEPTDGHSGFPIEVYVFFLYVIVWLPHYVFCGDWSVMIRTSVVCSVDSIWACGQQPWFINNCYSSTLPTWNLPAATQNFGSVLLKYNKVVPVTVGSLVCEADWINALSDRLTKLLHSGSLNKWMFSLSAFTGFLCWASAFNFCVSWLELCWHSGCVCFAGWERTAQCKHWEGTRAATCSCQHRQRSSTEYLEHDKPSAEVHKCRHWSVRIVNGMLSLDPLNMKLENEIAIDSNAHADLRSVYAMSLCEGCMICFMTLTHWNFFLCDAHSCITKVYYGLYRGWYDFHYHVGEMRSRPGTDCSNIEASPERWMPACTWFVFRTQMQLM